MPRCCSRPASSTRPAASSTMHWRRHAPTTTGSRSARSARGWPAATSSSTTSREPAATSVPRWPRTAARQVEELVRDAALIRSTIDVAAGHDLGAVITDLARRNERGGDQHGRRPGGGAAGGGGAAALGRCRRRRAPAVHARAHQPRLARGTPPRDARAGPARPRPRPARGGRAPDHHRQPAPRGAPVPVLEPRHARRPGPARTAARRLRRRASPGERGRRRHPHQHRAVARHLAPDQPGHDLDRPRAHGDDPRVSGGCGGSRPSARDDASADLVEEIGRLEDHVAQREWTLTVGGTSAGALPPVDADEARAATSDRDATVVEFFETGDELWTIVLDDGTLEVSRTGTVSVVREQLSRLRRDLRARAMVARGRRWRPPSTGRARHPSPRSTPPSTRPDRHGAARPTAASSSSRRAPWPPCRGACCPACWAGR